ncbi:DUF3667 domain-containing protein [Seonamhaeicola sp. NFXS20]|uniref:DUF3667 domain-containing protein n=1 Tax=Seonamhaeicola sp. NFXS20 TaxID=2816959 RepID=UPI003B8D0FD7
MSENNLQVCKNCNEPLKGLYCSHCGEKIVESQDFSIKIILTQFFSGLFNIDAKFYKTFINLIFKPGKLTVQYIEGVRKPFMKPIQVFLISNVLFFILLTQADILKIPSKYYFNSGREINIEQKLDKNNYSKVMLMQDFDIKSSNLSKSLVIIILPLMALVLLVLNFKTKFLYGMHIIFAMHYISFFFICCLMAISVSKLGNRAVQIFMISFNFLYLFFAIKKVYKNSYLISFFKAIILLVSFVGITGFYRELISFLSFKSI